MAPAASRHPVAALLGKVGAGKTHLFNKVCDAHRKAEITDDSCTRQFAKKTVFYGGKEMQLYDGPGCNSKEDVYVHSYVLKEGLSLEPLNGIFVACPYDPRIVNNMGGEFFEATKILKPEYFDLIVLLVTKMDLFKPDPNFPTRQSMEVHIKKTFKEVYDVDHVVFSDLNSQPKQLFDDMVQAVQGKPPMQISYTDGEFMQFFEMKAWKGRAQFDLNRMKMQIKKVCSDFEEGLNHLVETKVDHTHDEFQDYIYSMIQQNHVELNALYDKFTKHHGDNEIEFDDYVASIELQKLIHFAHVELRDEAKGHLAVNPDSHSDWRNMFRKCQHCGEIWVKVEGCDDETQCGARPSSKDAQRPDSLYRKSWERIDGLLRPVRAAFSTPKDGQAPAAPVPRKSQPIGCGESIVWKNQAVVPKAELDGLFSVQDLEIFFNNFTMNSSFQVLKREKEANIKVISELDEHGRDVVVSTNTGGMSSSSGYPAPSM